MVEKQSLIAATLLSKFNVTLIKEDKIRQYLGTKEMNEANIVKAVY